MPDEDARLLRELHDQHAQAVWRYVVHLTGDRAMADDVVQETLLRAWRKPAVLDQSQRSARACRHQQIGAGIRLAKRAAAGAAHPEMFPLPKRQRPRTIGQKKIAFVPKFLDAGKDVIPPSAIQSSGVIA